MSDLYSEAINSWVQEIFPDRDTGAYLNHDRVITIVAKPNIKIFYREDHVHVQCWISFTGVKPYELAVLYAEPQMFEILGKMLNKCKEIEQKACKSPQIAESFLPLKRCYVIDGYGAVT
jgi:hypothetical protein